MAAGWRYIAQRLTGDGAGEIVEWNLPLTDPQITKVLSGPDTVAGKITPEIGRLIADDGRLLLEEWGTAVYAEKDGQIRAGGILVHSQLNGHEWDLECVGFAGYPQGMAYTDSNFFVVADPLDIVRHIWDHLQSQPGGDLGVVVDGTVSPVRIGTVLQQAEFDTQAGPVSFEHGPFKLAWYMTDDLGSEIDKLAKETPFDYTESHTWVEGTANQIEHRIHLHYPRRGRRREDLRFAIGENVLVIPEVTRDGDEYANEILSLGAGEGSSMIRAGVSRPDGRLRRVAVVTNKDSRSVREAATTANLELAARQGLDEIGSIEVIDHPHAPIGSWSEGDEIHVTGDAGWVDVDYWCRVLSTTMSPGSGDSATLTIARTDTVTA